MPIFEYQCNACKTVFERLTLRPNTPTQIVCPECGSAQTAKVFSTFSTSAAGNGTVGTPGNATFS